MGRNLVDLICKAYKEKIEQCTCVEIKSLLRQRSVISHIHKNRKDTPQHCGCRQQQFWACQLWSAWWAQLVTAHRGQSSPQPRSWVILLLSGHTAPEAPGTTREKVTGDQMKGEKITEQAFTEFLNTIWIMEFGKVITEKWHKKDRKSVGLDIIVSLKPKDKLLGLNVNCVNYCKIWYLTPLFKTVSWKRIGLLPFKKQTNKQQNVICCKSPPALPSEFIKPTNPRHGCRGQHPGLHWWAKCYIPDVNESFNIYKIHMYKKKHYKNRAGGGAKMLTIKNKNRKPHKQTFCVNELLFSSLLLLFIYMQIK